MKTIICGGRNYQFTQEDFAWLDEQRMHIPITEVVQGGASGADREAKFWAIKRGIPNAEFRADWKQFGAIAGPIRNVRMAKYAGACIAFPGGRGTKDMISRALERGLKVIVRNEP